MGLYESKKVNIMPVRAGSVFGPSKLLLDEGGLKKFSVLLTFLRWRGLTKILVLTLITLYL